MVMADCDPAYDCRVGRTDGRENCVVSTRGELACATVRLKLSIVKDDLHALLANPEVFPVELTLTSGDKIKIAHPDYVHYARKLGKIFFYPDEGGGIFEMILPNQIAKIRGKIKKGSPRAA